VTDLLAIARDIAIEAGELAASRRREGVSVVATKSNVVDIVTQADRDAELLIRNRLAELRPDDGFYGEESGAEAGTSGLTWVVDPIDGTVNFLYGLPNYAVSIAVVEGAPDPLTWRALAGCVVNPSTGEVYTAVVGGGAFCNDRPISVAPAPPLGEALVATGFVYDLATRVHQGEVAGGLLGEVRDIRRMGSAALDLCAVASGRLNAYYESALSPWDHAAGALIAREAGAVVKGWGDSPAGRELVLAAHPELVGALETALAGFGY
jgi:myo-inositol-1(or 4)-monophosphatase